MLVYLVLIHVSECTVFNECHTFSNTYQNMSYIFVGVRSWAWPSSANFRVMVFSNRLDEL